MDRTLPASTWRLGYRPALDGLRGIAILLVMAMHFGLPFPNGGRAGVALFFVLSGFLITTLLLEEHERSGGISLRRFYARRARRLLPALFAVLLVVTGLAIAQGEWDERWPAIVTTAGYVANWANGYGVDMGGLEHTWTLAIEEQFYLCWPIALLALLGWSRGSQRRILLVIFAGIVVSVASRMTPFTELGSQPHLYFGVERADELLLGCGLAVLTRTGWRLPTIYGWVGLVALTVISVIPLPRDGLDLSLIPIALAAATVVAIAAHDSVIARALAWAPLVRIGILSYSLYLWHLPVKFALGREWSWNADTLWLIVPVYVGVTVPIALASYRWIERPWRRRVWTVVSQPSTQQAVAAEG